MLALEVLEKTVRSLWKSIQYEHSKKSDIKNKPD